MSVWCWEVCTASFPAVQHILPGNRFALAEQDMEAQVEALAATGKLDRVSAFRQVQAVSHSLHQITEGRMNLETFSIPERVCLRPVTASEIRVLRPAAAGGLMSLLFDRHSRTATPTLPEASPMPLSWSSDWIRAPWVQQGWRMHCMPAPI